jgi:hypothetical protein
MFNKRAGKIKIRIFALLLLILSCGIMISAYRSLSREFSGIVVKKQSSPGFSSNNYWLYLAAEPLTLNSSDTTLLDSLLSEQGFENSSALNRVGVSSVVYEESSELTIVKKKSMSPFINVQNSSHIDLGINWLLMSLAGIFLSIWMYRQTLKSRNNEKYESEDLEIPGL